MHLPVQFLPERFIHRAKTNQVVNIHSVLLWDPATFRMKIVEECALLYSGRLVRGNKNGDQRNSKLEDRHSKLKSRDCLTIDWLFPLLDLTLLPATLLWSLNTRSYTQTWESICNTDYRIMSSHVSLNTRQLDINYYQCPLLAGHGLPRNWLLHRHRYAGLAAKVNLTAKLWLLYRQGWF